MTEINFTILNISLTFILAWNIPYYVNEISYIQSIHGYNKINQIYLQMTYLFLKLKIQGCVHRNQMPQLQAPIGFPIRLNKGLYGVKININKI